MKTETTTALLLCPDQLTSDFNLIQFLSIERGPGKLDFSASPCLSKDVRKYFAQAQPMVQSAIAEFDQKSIHQQLEEIKLAVQKSQTNSSDYIKNNMLRILQGKLEKLKPLAPAIKCYHRFLEEGKWKVAPAKFSSYRPQPFFRVVKKEGGLAIETYFKLNDSVFPASGFSSYKFLLRSGNEYFLLLFKDYKILQWLEDQDMDQAGKAASVFESQILARLEEDYEVDRNNLFTDTILSPEPINRIYLNELAGAFLMLTPQWKYDEFLVEGPFQEVYKTTLQGKPYSVRRNSEKETAFIDLLKSLHPNFPAQLSKGYFYLSFADAQKKQWFLKAYHKLLELDIELTGLDMLKHFKMSSFLVESSIEILEKTEKQITLRAKIIFGNELVPLIELQKTLMAGQHAVLLKDGSLGVLGEDWLEQYSILFKHGRINKDTITVSSWMAMQEEQTQSDQLILRRTIPDNWWQKWKQWQNPETSIYPLPAGINATLRPYQQKGYEWLTLLSELGAGACLADDMGLGKTLQTIAFLCSQIEQDSKAKCLIVCPASLLYNWQNECSKFATGLSTYIYHGPNRSDLCFSDNTQIVISTYGTIRADGEKLQSISFSTIVLDESHHIKNPSAQVTQVVSGLIAKSRIALSGTPVMNNTFDLYAQLNFTVPGLFGSREFFKKEYADAIDISGDEEKLKALNKLTAPFLLRRTKEQVAPDLPAKTEIILWCEMGPAQKQQYEDIRDQVRSNLLDNIKKAGFSKSKLFLLQAITKLRQVCNSPLLLPDNERQCYDSIKTDMLMDELINNLGGHKTLVFSQFSSMLDLLAEECTRRGLSFFHFDGQTPAAKRSQMVESFQSPEDKTPVFLISLKAGNAGLNLTAADYVFLVDPWWNTAVQQQAIDRTHRIGQDKAIFAYQMICKDSIEEKIIAIQQRKKRISEELIVAEEGFLQELSEEDVLYLFS